VELAAAHKLASRNHVGQHNRFGDPVIEHVERVAAAVPADAQATALLHDLLELSPTARWQLRRQDLSRTEQEALELLTHAPGETYEAYVRRIADAAGPAGRLARVVKCADLEDHLAHPSIPSDAPPYAWARKLLAERERTAQTAPATPAPARRPRAKRRTSESLR
jgi:hypothetical protein